MILDIKIEDETFKINGYIESIARVGFHGVFAFEEIELAILSIDYSNISEDVKPYVAVLENELIKYLEYYRAAIDKYKKLMIFA